MVVFAGALATTGCEPRQVRKEAAAAANACAEVPLAEIASIIIHILAAYRKPTCKEYGAAYDIYRPSPKMASQNVC